MIIKDKQGIVLGDFELFDRDGLWGILVDRVERIPFCHKTRFGAIDELMFFLRDNLKDRHTGNIWITIIQVNK